MFKKPSKNSIIEELRKRICSENIIIPKDIGLSLEDFMVNEYINNSPIRNIWLNHLYGAPMVVRPENGAVMVTNVSVGDDEPNRDWPERDHIPVNRDPIGDIDPMEQFKKDDVAYMQQIKEAGKHIDHGIDFIITDITIANESNCCSNPQNHKKTWLVTSAYKRCTVCGADLGDWLDS